MTAPGDLKRAAAEGGETMAETAKKIVEGLSEAELRALVVDRLRDDPDLGRLLTRHEKRGSIKTLGRLFDLALTKADKALAEGNFKLGLSAYFMCIERAGKMSLESDDHDGSPISGR
jgi:hypothetical protein